MTPASAEDRGEVERLARTVQAVTDDAVELAWVDQGYTGERAANGAARHGIALEVVTLPEVKRGFVLLPRRRVVERSFAWATRDSSSKTMSVTLKHSRDFTSSPSLHVHNSIYARQAGGTAGSASHFSQT